MSDELRDKAKVCLDFAQKAVKATAKQDKFTGVEMAGIAGDGRFCARELLAKLDELDAERARADAAQGLAIGMEMLAKRANDEWYLRCREIEGRMKTAERERDEVHRDLELLQLSTRWISVAEGMPGGIEQVEVVTEGGWVVAARYLKDRSLWISDQGELRPVTHWKPLSAPPEAAEVSGGG